MVYNLLNDLKTLIDAHDFTGHADLTADPLVVLSRDEIPTNYTQANGLVILDKESLNNIEPTGNDFEHMHYRVLGSILFQGQTTDVKLKAVLSRIRKLFNTNNKAQGRIYTHEQLYEWDNRVADGSIPITIQSVERHVPNG